MSNFFAWALFALGIAHIVFGVVKFRGPLRDALAAGFIGQFYAPEVRRTAFWFVLLGPALVLAGHVAVHAVAVGDVWLLRTLGWYVLAMTVVGFAAIPKSPFPAGLAVSLGLLASSYGFLG